MTWLDKLIDPLLHPKYPQIKGRLAVYDDVDGSLMVVGKCAEGEIACQNGVKYGKHAITLGEGELHSIGIPDEFLKNLPFIYLHSEEIGDDVEDGHTGLGTYLWTLNDIGLTYPEIAEFLRTTFEDAV